jgi:hypothetical protein
MTVGRHILNAANQSEMVQSCGKTGGSGSELTYLSPTSMGRERAEPDYARNIFSCHLYDEHIDAVVF